MRNLLILLLALVVISCQPDDFLLENIDINNNYQNTPPSLPQIVIEGSTANSLSISWSAFDTDDGTDLRYDLALNGTLVLTNTTATSYTFENLDNAIQYSISVLAKDSEGLSTLNSVPFTFPCEPQISDAVIFSDPTEGGVGTQLIIVFNADGGCMTRIESNGITLSPQTLSDFGAFFDLTEDQFNTLNDAADKSFTLFYEEAGVEKSLTGTYNNGAGSIDSRLSDK